MKELKMRKSTKTVLKKLTEHQRNHLRKILLRFTFNSRSVSGSDVSARFSVNMNEHAGHKGLKVGVSDPDLARYCLTSLLHFFILLNDCFKFTRQYFRDIRLAVLETIRVTIMLI